MKKPAHPSQPLVHDKFGVIRFKQNSVVRFLLDHGGFDLNALAKLDFTCEDRAQFAQLIGYSVSGWGELNYVPLRAARAADDRADRLQASLIRKREKGGGS